MGRVFYQRDTFTPTPTSVSLLPFRFIRLNGKELLVNEAGEFLFAPSGTVASLADGVIDTTPRLRCSICLLQKFEPNMTT